LGLLLHRSVTGLLLLLGSCCCCTVITVADFHLHFLLLPISGTYLLNSCCEELQHGK